MELIVLRDGEEHRVAIEPGDKGSVVRIGERTYLVDRVPTSGTVRSLVIEGRQFEVSVRPNSGGRYQFDAHFRVWINLLQVIDELRQIFD